MTGSYLFRNAAGASPNKDAPRVGKDGRYDPLARHDFELSAQGDNLMSHLAIGDGFDHLNDLGPQRRIVDAGEGHVQGDRLSVHVAGADSGKFKIEEVGRVHAKGFRYH